MPRDQSSPHLPYPPTAGQTSRLVGPNGREGRWGDHLRDLLQGTIRWLKQRRLDYGEIRFHRTTRERLVVENLAVENISRSSDAGFGVRVLADGAWGFAATPLATAAALRKAAAEACAIAKATARVNRKPFHLVPIKPMVAQHRSHWEIDPFTVPYDKKLDYLMWACRELKDHRAIQRAIGSLDFYRIEKMLVSTEGADIQQEFIESAGQLEAVATGSSGTQRRSYPNSHDGSLAQAGYEYVKQLDLVGGAKRIREEVVTLLNAPELTPGETTVILDTSQMALQVHESCGHPVELDRVLGTELSYAGGSFLNPEKLGHFRYGSPLVNIVADATSPGGVGSFAYDDEGVAGQRYPIIDRGMFVGYLSSRETAAKLGLFGSSGAMRAESWEVPPLIRMTNINLEPGEPSLEELIRDTKKGLLLSTNKSWSIDDQRLNFQFSTEIGWEIIKGRLGRVVKNPIYTGITPEFWGRCSGIANRSSWRMWGIPNCGKGEPGQAMHVGHGAPAARFEKVFVGRRR